MFFVEIQNKLFFVIIGKIVVEIIVSRVNENEINMVLINWKGIVVRKQDIFIVKNYLIEDEIDSLNCFIVVFLEIVELRVKNRQDIIMNFWKENVDKILNLNDKFILYGKGSISNF